MPPSFILIVEPSASKIMSPPTSSVKSPLSEIVELLIVISPTVNPEESITALSVPPVSNLILSSSLDSSTCTLVSASASLKILAVV